jgi:molybdopterin converting factor small subunit
MKAYSYIHIDALKPFNYNEIFSVYRPQDITAIKKEFGITSRKTIEEFYKDYSIGSVVTEQKVTEWNKGAKSLIESSYFEFYKKRLVIYRRLKGAKDKKNFKSLLNEKKWNLLNNLSFDFELRRWHKNLTKDQVALLLRDIDEDDYRRMVKMPAAIYDMDALIAYFLMSSLHLEDYSSLVVDRNLEYFKSFKEALKKGDVSLIQEYANKEKVKK